MPIAEGMPNIAPFPYRDYVTAKEDLELAMRSGVFYAVVIGPSGTGKTSLERDLGLGPNDDDVDGWRVAVCRHARRPPLDDCAPRPQGRVGIERRTRGADAVRAASRGEQRAWRSSR